MTLPELALRFILASPDVTTVIPGMRRPRTWRRIWRVSDGRPLSADVWPGSGAPVDPDVCCSVSKRLVRHSEASKLGA